MNAKRHCLFALILLHGGAALAAALPDEAGRQVLERMCSSCHGLPLVTAVPRTGPEWKAVVQNMVRRGAVGTDRDIAQVTEYLTSHFGKAETPATVAPPVSRHVVFSEEARRLQVPGQTDWQAFGHDPGATRYSPLAQINRNNVRHLAPAWTYDTGERGQPFEVTPLVVNNTMYAMTPGQRVVALEPETGRELWRYDPRVSRSGAGRGVSYWPGDAQNSARILFGTLDGRLIALDAATGKPVPQFGDNGQVNLRAGVADEFPKAQYSISSPPAIYRHLAILGPELQEGPSRGPSGDARAFDVRTGKVVWSLPVLPRPGQPGSETWETDSSQQRSGPSAWSFMTVDVENGMVFLPTGNPADSFYGADRKGKNLYANSIVAVDAMTGKMRWSFQMVHHDIFDYDIAAAPALITVTQGGKQRPAVAEITKSGLLFILDRMTGEPVFGVEERLVPQSDVPGEQSWPTQPFPLKPPPLARNRITPEEISTLSPESEKFCRELLRSYPNSGPYTPFQAGGSSLFPSTMGGGNWGGMAFDPKLGYLFVNTSSFGSIGKMIKSSTSAMPYRNEGGYARFVDQNRYPCNRPPWGELTAVNANTGEIAWRVPLGSYRELESRGIPVTGTPNIGGPIITSAGLLFIGSTNDGRFRAFDVSTGAQLWQTDLVAPGEATPVTYLGRDGKQYVVIATGSAGHLRSVGPARGDAATLAAFALPD